MPIVSRLNEQLETWDDLAESEEYTGLLIGNGASRAVWEGFAYPSLFDMAKAGNISHRLTAEDIQLFESLETENFERVLSALATTRQVSESLGFAEPEFKSRYSSIQRALVEAVRSRHMPWIKVPDRTLQAIQDEFLRYRFVYSTNYDLLAYWSVMHESPVGFKDLFWSGSYFDLANTEVWGKATVILYLHGGLHLYRTLDGRTMKRTASIGSNLLDLFGLPMTVEATPLFISEGSAKQKLESIYRSDYLAFAYSTLVHHAGPLCIFGHSLGDVDQHIVDAIKKSQIRDIAFSVLPLTKAGIIEVEADAIRKLPEANIRFFDATSHPLGSPDLLVSEEGA